MDRRVGADGVGAPCVQLLERVGRVAGEHHVAALVVDADHRDVPGRVARCRDGDDASVGAERVAAREGAEGPAVERERGGAKPAGSGWRSTRRITRESGAASVARAPRSGFAPGRGRGRVPSTWSPWWWVSTTSQTSVGESPAAAERAGQLLLAGHLEACERDVARGGGLAGVDRAVRRSSCSIAQQWIGSGSENGPGRNRSSWRRAPSLAKRKERLTCTVPVLRAWMRILRI